jgi:2-C-methyl-D-erythritol 4-phosphate cytidylyltransferase/2-C-methyl-D-erythritol 2,4-cyclodiphosphate synthase
MSFWAVLVAAGQGTRFGRPKHDYELRGRPLWQWSHHVLTVAGAGDVIVVGSVPGGVEGGRRRRDSVANGLARVPDDVRHVLVHDAARPLVSVELVRRVVERLEAGDVDAVVPGLPVRDTVKRVDGETIVATVPRGDLIAVQTPQGFVAERLREAHQVEGDAPDDAWLVEQIGGRVVYVAGEPANIKVTYPEDITLVEALL